MSIKQQYEVAKQIYKSLGVDTDQAIKQLSQIKLSLQCWQGDDVKGFLFKERDLTGGISVTGHYPYKATNIKELREDLEKVYTLIPGKHKLNLHAIYADTKDAIDLDALEPKHFESWVLWAKKHGLGLDFNPTCFSHPKVDRGFTLSAKDEEIRNFWINHVKKSRKISEYFGKELNQKSVCNIWIPDGFKDEAYDLLTPRKRLKASLDEIFKEKLNDHYILDTMESKLFGLGVEGATIGSHEFYLSYALKNNKSVCLDSGHFHPTESIGDKLSAITLFMDEILLHVSRPMRWDSDHVPVFNDMTQNIANHIIRHDLQNKIHIGFDFFDASINRVAAWVTGARSFQMALLKALLEPKVDIAALEDQGDYTSRLVKTELFKTLPFGIVYDYFCELNGVAKQNEVLDIIKVYEQSIGREK